MHKAQKSHLNPFPRNIEIRLPQAWEGGKEFIKVLHNIAITIAAGYTHFSKGDVGYGKNGGGGGGGGGGERMTQGFNTALPCTLYGPYH